MCYKLLNSARTFMHKIKKRKVLFIDHESGHGGSSISLYNKIKLICKENYEITIILKKNSYILKKYKNINVKVKLLKIPTVTSLSKTLPNFIYLFKFFFKFFFFNLKNKKFYYELESYDNIHLNHENLYWLLRKIKNYVKNKSKVTISIRTILADNFFSKLQSNIINKFADKKLFISKINQIKFNELIENKKKNNFILENFILKEKKSNNFLYMKSKKKYLNVISVANYSRDRGLDRILKIAEMFNLDKNKNIFFSFVGDYKIKSFKDFIISNPNNNLKFLAKIKKLNNVNFYGHKRYVTKYLDKANILIYLPRTDSSWGRNIIESLCFGVPVITCGTTNTLIKNNINGYFFKNYEPKKIFNYVKLLNDNRNLLYQMSVNAKLISSKRYKKSIIKKRLLEFIEK